MLHTVPLKYCLYLIIFNGRRCYNFVYTVQCVGGDVIMGTVSVADQRLDAEFSQNLESGKMEFYEKVL